MPFISGSQTMHRVANDYFRIRRFKDFKLESLVHKTNKFVLSAVVSISLKVHIALKENLDCLACNA